MPQPHRTRTGILPKPSFDFEDELKFLQSWFQKPWLTGAVAPSSRHLARTMARYVDPHETGPIIELGPGTGVVTEALLDRGVPQERLILVEFNPKFVSMMTSRFSRATVIQGDAYSLAQTLGSLQLEKPSALVSSLPLVTRPLPVRIRLLKEAFQMMTAGAPFIQFTYSLMPPIPRRLPGITVERSERVWKNLPPAQVWVYRRLATLLGMDP